MVKEVNEIATLEGYLQEKLTKSPTFFPFTTLMLLIVAEKGLEIENFCANVKVSGEIYCQCAIGDPDLSIGNLESSHHQARQ